MNHLFFKQQLKRKLALPSIFLLSAIGASAQQKVQDSTKIQKLDEVLISAVRVNAKSPISFSNMSKEELAKRNLGQDIPILMNYLPSVVTTSDAGNGLGYTGIRVRGSDATRVNVTINGIPYNDAESQGTFWVNMPDFVSSVESLQLQRGVGTSTNGSGAFGASLNLLTDSYNPKASAEISSAAGSFNTFKNTVKFSTGLLNEHFELAGRLSVLKSDGYIDRATSDLKSYFLQGTYVGKTSLFKALAFGGKEKTYQSWFGVDAATLENDRTFNAAGMFTDEFGNERFYDNQTDNYQQDHFQLHWNERIGEYWSSNIALHYTKGKGYYEDYKENRNLAEYGLLPIAAAPTVSKTDLVRQKWLDNDFYGSTFSLSYKKDDWNLIVGGGWNKYAGDHFGKVIWARFASQSELGDHYYDDVATKTDGNIFAKATYKLAEKWSLFADMQYRNVNYKANAVETGQVNDTFNFFNPKAGLNFELNPSNFLYFSYAKANREPNRTDYENGNPKPEELDDFELGWRLKKEQTAINVNGYFMKYKDQLVLTGELDEVGSPVRKNSGNSYRLGLEVDATIKFAQKWSVSPNFTLSSNQNIDFVATNADGSLTNLGDTDIAYSPEFIAGNILSFSPLSDLSLSLLSKFVSSQFVNNTEDKKGELNDYFVNDFNAVYQFDTQKVFKSIAFSLLVNNLFNVKYVSNAYQDGDGTAYYFPQAGTHFLAGVTFKF